MKRQQVLILQESYYLKTALSILSVGNALALILNAYYHFTRHGDTMIKFLFLLLALFSFNAIADTAIFAGGCFWCMQPPFDALKSKGVLKTTVGYTGGTKENPTYEQTSSGTTGHREAIEVVFDSKKISYKDLLKVFWENIDPFDKDGQFCDKGEQYTAAIFYSTEEQKKEAELSKPKGNVVTSILPAKKFFPAETYHQSYYEKNPVRYKFYRFNCGRDKRLKEVWGHSAH